MITHKEYWVQFITFCQKEKRKKKRGVVQFIKEVKNNNYKRNIRKILGRSIQIDQVEKIHRRKILWKCKK